jgi:hypothetical protein
LPYLNPGLFGGHVPQEIAHQGKALSIGK